MPEQAYSGGLCDPDPAALRENETPHYLPIAEYGIIGDMHTAVLIAADGSIEWGCLPYFDSPALFLRLLDWQKGGYSAIRIAELVRSSRRYIEGTNILETTFATRSGTLVLTDFMPIQAHEERERFECRVIRLLHCTAGHVDFVMDTKPTFGFASEPSRHYSRAPGVIAFEGRGQTLLVQGPNLAMRQEGRVVASGRVAAGEKKFLALSCSPPGAHLDAIDDACSALEETKRQWMEWSGRLCYEGDYREEILRSILVLKLLTFAPTGAIVAAPTTSLPEVFGGNRNWDYRLSWIRDSQFVLTALMQCGYLEEAHEFFRFLKQAASGPVDQLQILYSIRGERSVGETELNYLEGYRESRPVRDGNAAGRQKQSDIYGELLNCMFTYCHMASSEADREARAAEIWPLARSMADYVVRHWREPDHGIWESRGAAQQFVHSKAMCWTALDRAIRLAPIAHATSRVQRWRLERDTILESLGANGFNAKLGVFVQSYGSNVLDASILRLPLQGVIDAWDPRMLSTIRQLERCLLRNGLLYRYAAAEGQIEEGTFTSCTLWLINNYILLGRMKQAREAPDHLLLFKSKLGLFAEEIKPETGEQLGNFPQALTHVALIGAIRHLEGRPRPGAMQPLPRRLTQ